MFLGLPFHFWYGVYLAVIVVILAELVARYKDKRDARS
ncbi:hypothetical protein [Acinetobacter phage IME-200]|uniref:Uncharacterized protein n=1 Tax=Acinetobacter phage IME-200 TaxID=1735582 RepID=A0A0N7IR65_9CAUD|nr:membrane protein [Acinetobacter phage IME-200]ALJ97646.1 hypothetical protein [Acinetobacter phage IME-200]